MRGATARRDIRDVDAHISIHAPRAGSDSFHVLMAVTPSYFNPRSPCGERPPPSLRLVSSLPFQSTLPVRGATDALKLAPKSRAKFQSTLPVRGATSRAPKRKESHYYFNPRSPCGERLVQPESGGAGYVFQSTLPVRGATLYTPQTLTDEQNFNPRSPCGERRYIRQITPVNQYFNPHSPCGERRSIKDSPRV